MRTPTPLSRTLNGLLILMAALLVSCSSSLSKDSTPEPIVKPHLASASQTEKPKLAGDVVPVTVENFARAECDVYFDKTVRHGGFGKLTHNRTMTPIDKQEIVRMNRDTIYSDAVFDLDAGPITLTLPNSGKRFMSMQVISEDHYTVDVTYAPGRHQYTRSRVGTRYVFVIIRTLINPDDADDIKAANRLQDAIKVEQANAGSWEVPNWDPESQQTVREALAVLGSKLGTPDGQMFGSKAEVDSLLHLIGTAIGWGGNPRSAAIYSIEFPKENDGKTIYRLRARDVPVDGFWSISVYNDAGYFEKNAEKAYSVNNLTAKKSKDGSIVIQFGGTSTDASINVIPITEGWNYVVRLYRPRKEVLDGAWKFPQAQPVS